MSKARRRIERKRRQERQPDALPAVYGDWAADKVYSGPDGASMTGHEVFDAFSVLSEDMREMVMRSHDAQSLDTRRAAWKVLENALRVARIIREYQDNRTHG